ncbi:MAG: NCS2 family permease [Candidatus Coatesbacteria bacterium]|nr:MAG: NCS2 family permease [Candidatus Coatesbacteria bacterium]
MVERFFHIKERGSTVRREVLGGVVTFMTMSYIIFVNPAILSAAGLDFGGALVATCIAAATGTLLLGLLANYPIAQAPGMGLNAYFAYTVVLMMGVPWRTALGAVFISGLLFIILTLCRVRSLIVDALPPSVRKAIAAGIGLFIAFIGLEKAGFVALNQATFVTLGDVTHPAALLAVFGLLVTVVMLVLRWRGALLWGMLLTAVAAVVFGHVKYTGIISAPESIAPVFVGPLRHLVEVGPLPTPNLFLEMDVAAAFRLGILNVIFVFLFIDMFDTLGTFLGVAQHGKFLDAKGNMPRINRALISDGVATSVGAAFGTSTTTSYIESAAGIAAGARTGLANVVTAVLFLVAPLFLPLAKMIGGGVMVTQAMPVEGILGGEAVGGLLEMTRFLQPITAPALIIVGSFMLTGLRDIKWSEPVESIPAFLTLIAIPLTFSIANGITLGFISYPIVMIFARRWREVSPLAYILAVLFVVRLIFLAA